MVILRLRTRSTLAWLCLSSVVVCLVFALGCSRGGSRGSFQTEFASAIGDLSPNPIPTSAKVALPSPGRLQLDDPVGELDRVQRVENRFYALSEARGLAIFDLDEKETGLRLLSRSPVPGTPLRMIVRGDRVVVVTHDTVALVGDTPETPPVRGGRALLFDVSVPAEPREIASLELDGFVTGLSLKNGVLYATLQRDFPAPPAGESEFSVVSIDLSSRDELSFVDRIDFPHGVFADSTFFGEVLILIEFESTVGPSPEREDRLRVVDLGDPSGLLSLRGALVFDSFPGVGVELERLGDLILGVVPGSSTLFSVSIADLDAPRLLSFLPIITRLNEFVSEVRFDGRHVFLSLGGLAVDFLVVDFTEPSAPRILRQASIGSRVDSFQVRDGVLFTLRRGAEGQGRLEVALYESSNPDRLELLQVVGFEDPALIGGGQFRILDEEGVLMVPYGVEDASARSFYKSRVQLFDVDFASRTIRPRGRFDGGDHPDRVLRVGADDVILASDFDVTRTRISDLDRPVVRGVRGFGATVRDLVVRDEILIQLDSESFEKNSLSLHPADRPDGLQPISTLELEGAVHGLLAHEDFVYVLGSNRTGDLRVTVVDVGFPSEPRFRSALEVPIRIPYLPDYPFYKGSGWYHIGLDEPDAVQIDGTTVVVQQALFEDQKKLTVIDLADPDAPRVASVLEIPSAERLLTPLASGRELLVSHFELLSTRTDPITGLPNTAKYYVDRFDLSDPSAPRLVSTVNVPGRLVSLDENGRHAVTIDHQFVSSDPTDLEVRVSLCAVDLGEERALLLERRELGFGFSLHFRGFSDRVVTLSRVEEVLDDATSTRRVHHELQSFSTVAKSRFVPLGKTEVPLGSALREALAPSERRVAFVLSDDQKLLLDVSRSVPTIAAALSPSQRFSRFVSDGGRRYLIGFTRGIQLLADEESFD